MEMTLTYARITDRVVADEYDAIGGKIALYLWRWCCHLLFRSSAM